MSGRSSRGGRGDGRAPWRRWCVGRLDADDRLGDLRAFLFDGAADLEGLPGAAEGGEGELVEDGAANGVAGGVVGVGGEGIGYDGLGRSRRVDE